MSLGRTSYPERVITHGVLIAGAIIFAFPFVWMVGTSAKIRREMAADRLKVWPAPGRPQNSSPYVDVHEYGAPKRPDGIAPAVWEALRPRLEEQLAQAVRGWRPQTPSPADNVAPAPLKAELRHAEMVEGLFEKLGARLSDEARGKALEKEKELRLAQDPKASVDYAALADSLSDEALEAGVKAILADAARLTTEDLLRETFNTIYRRFCLGALRLRTRDYQSHPLFTGDEWRAAGGPVTLVERIDEVAVKAQEARIHFAPNAQSVTFRFPIQSPAFALEEIDRIFVGYRADAAWGDLVFEVLRDGQLWRTTDKISCADRDWVEQELRWPGDEGAITARRIFSVLQPAGAAPVGSPPLEVRVTLTKSGTLGAQYAKATRNYRQAFKEIPYARYIMTSFSLTILNIVLAIFSCTLVAYAFARLEWPGRDLCFGILLATMMIPPQVTMIPQFLINKHLGFYNTLVPLWIFASFGAPFFIFLLRQFFKNVPIDLEDAARIDGCGFLRIYWHVMLPLVKPTIATIAIFTLMWTWNNFMGPLIYVNDERLFPLALGLFKFQISVQYRAAGDVGLMMAGSFIMTLPIITLFFFVQRYFIQGISLTGMKG